MKKSLALVLALIMVLSSFSFVSAAPDFADVKGTKYEDAVARLELLNVLKGYPDGSFKPENTITRAEFAAVAVRAKGLAGVAEAAKGLPSGFSDVPAGHWAAGYVGVAGSTGIVNGIGGGLFAPNAPVKYEEAVTMLVRALGYEVSAQTKGGYPFGYLIVAKEIDLLDDVIGTMGVPATRGMVAMLTDNALEIPMMVQVGFGTDTKWVVSGTGDSEEEVFLLDFMGFKAVEGRVVDFDSEDMWIELDNADEDVLDVNDNFDFFAAEYVKIKAWVDGDEVIAYTLKETAKYDAIKADGSKVKLVTEDKSYSVDADEFDVPDPIPTANFAKVVLNSSSKVMALKTYSLDEFMVADKIDDGILIDLNDDEWDLEDYTVVKDGKTVEADDIMKGDIVFFDEGAELAVVFNKSVKGEIDRVYTDSFRLGGKVYAIANPDFGALYLDGSTLDKLTIDVVESMMDEESTVSVYFDFNKKVVLVEGETGDIATSTFYAVVTEDTNMWTSRSGNMWSLDVFTEKGEEVAYDVKEADIDDIYGTVPNWDANVQIGALAKVTVDEDGEVTEVKLLTAGSVDPFDIEDTYIGSNRLMDSTIIFYDYKDDAPRKVIKLGDVDDEFFKIETATAYSESGRVKVVLATKTDSDTESKSTTGLVTKVRVLRTDYIEFTMEVGGVEKVYLTDGKVTDTTEINGYLALQDNFAKVEVGDVSGKLMTFGTPAVYAVKVNLSGEYKVVSRSTIDKTILVYENTTLELLSSTVIYDGEWDIINLRDIVQNDIVQVIFDGNSTRFVKYVVVKAIK
jgi:hypothetical protein